jgi:hypothetical protein
VPDRVSAGTVSPELAPPRFAPHARAFLRWPAGATEAVVNFIQTLPQYGSYPHARTMCEAFTPAISQFMAPGTRRLAGDFLQSGDAEIWRSYARKNLKGPIHRYLGCVDARPGHCRHCPRARSCARQGPAGRGGTRCATPPSRAGSSPRTRGEGALRPGQLLPAD